MSHKKRFSDTMILHHVRLVYRSCLFLIALISYIAAKLTQAEHIFGGAIYGQALLAVFFVIYAFEIITRFFPLNIESLGSQKHFKKNYIKKAEYNRSALRKKGLKDAALVLAFWLPLNGIFAVLFFTGVIDWGIMVLIALAYGICDSVCILYFCPFQTWFMKNRCCSSCRIYNWDYAMMATPLIFIIHPASLVMAGLSFILLAVWEISFFTHPERFSPETNECLSCASCKERLCIHKRQLRSFQRKRLHSANIKEAPLHQNALNCKGSCGTNENNQT